MMTLLYRCQAMIDDEQKAEIQRAMRADDLRIGGRLRDARQAADMTLEQAPQHIGVTKAQLGHLEAGRNPLTASKLGVLSRLYRQSCDWLILGLRRNGATPGGARLLSIFDELPERERDAVLEFAEDRLRRAGAPARKSHAA